MLARFWGVRGSIPVANTGFLKYGGSTSCLEVRTLSGQTIVFDAGTGIRALGSRLVQETPAGGHRILLFLTHYHWDHIQGLPFFEPMYAPGNIIYMHGFKSERVSVERALGDQMANPFFPVDPSVMRATRNYYNISEETLQFGSACLTSRALNHPQGALGYRLEDGGRVLVYATDHEHGDPTGDRNVRALAENADVFIYDSQYTPEEYPQKKGWGHSTWEEGVRIAQEMGVKELVLFHHDPDHDDFAMDSILRDARQHFPSTHAAFRGMEIDLASFSDEITHYARVEKRFNTRHHIPLMMAMHTENREDLTKIEDLSLDGIYFLADAPLEPGTKVKLEIDLSPTNGGDGKIRGLARVVRCERIGDKVGIAVTFR